MLAHDRPVVNRLPVNRRKFRAILRKIAQRYMESAIPATDTLKSRSYAFEPRGLSPRRRSLTFLLVVTRDLFRQRTMTVIRRMLHSERFFRGLVIGAVIATAGVMLVVYLHLVRDSRAHDNVELAILELSLNKPDSVTSSQWSLCLLHTWNLNSNYAAALDADELNELAEVLRAGDGTTRVIDDFWSKYVSLTDGRAASYDAHYRPTTPAMLAQDYGSASGDYGLEYWISRYRAVSNHAVE